MQRARTLSRPGGGRRKWTLEAVRRFSKGLHPHSAYKQSLAEQINCGDLSLLFQAESAPLGGMSSSAPSTVPGLCAAAPARAAGGGQQQKRKLAQDRINELVERKRRRPE